MTSYMRLVWRVITFRDWSRSCLLIKSEVREARGTAELERYRAMEKERAKWKERDARLLAQLKEAQSRVEQG